MGPVNSHPFLALLVILAVVVPALTQEVGGKCMYIYLQKKILTSSFDMFDFELHVSLLCNMIWRGGGNKIFVLWLHLITFVWEVW